MQEGKANKHVDETSCGPLCQHPLCWASNRRVERGLPRVVEAKKKNLDISLKDDLPTLKVVDLFGGENPLSHSHRHGRSSSAPLLENKLRQTSQENSPLTPTVSPATTGLPADSKKQPFKAPVLKKIEVHELVDWPNDWSDNFIGSHFYLWCTTRASSKRQTDAKFLQSTGCISSKHPEYVRVKDVTEDLLPSSVQKEQKQKKKKHGSHKTPTGGRPYISPSKGSLPRSYLKSPREDEISQLLSLPREVLLQVIDHANNSEIYDKDRVHRLLQKVLPQIHFQQHVLAQQKELARKRNTAGTPLEESGILRNKKVQLKEGPKVTSDQTPLVQSKLFILDNNVNSKVQNNEKEIEEKMENEKIPEKMNNVEEIAKTQKKALAPLKGVRPEPSKSLTKLTSISTRTLSPLQAGTSPTKPFNYSAKRLDWTLGPLPSKEKKVVFKPVTPPQSEKASTLHVTIPSVMSPDRMSLLASATSRDRSSCPPSRNKSPYHQSLSMDSSLTPEENPIHAISPGLSTNFPLASLSTPSYLQKQGSFKKGVPSKPSTTNHEDHTQESLPKTPVNTPFHTEHQQQEQNLGAIQERMSEKSSPSISESVNIPVCVKQQSPVSQSINNQSCMSPWEEFNSIAVQPSEKMNPSPVQVMTPALTGVTTPDHWPSVDEQEYLNSATEKLAEEVISPAAPPPSPEPVVFESDSAVTDEIQNISKSVVTTSLTPLQEEEDEDEETLEEDAVNKEVENTGDIQTKLENVNNVDNNGQNSTETNRQPANHAESIVIDSNQGIEDKCVEDKEIKD